MTAIIQPFQLLWNPPLLIFTLYSSDVVLKPIRFVARSLCMASSRPKVWEPGCGSNQLEKILTNRFFQVVMNCSFQFWQKELVVSETFKLLNDQPVYWQNMFPQAKRKRHSWPTWPTFNLPFTTEVLILSTGCEWSWPPIEEPWWSDLAKWATQSKVSRFQWFLSVCFS